MAIAGKYTVKIHRKVHRGTRRTRKYTKEYPTAPGGPEKYATKYPAENPEGIRKGKDICHKGGRAPKAAAPLTGAAEGHPQLSLPFLIPPGFSARYFFAYFSCTPGTVGYSLVNFPVPARAAVHFAV